MYIVQLSFGRVPKLLSAIFIYNNGFEVINHLYMYASHPFSFFSKWKDGIYAAIQAEATRFLSFLPFHVILFMVSNALGNYLLHMGFQLNTYTPLGIKKGNNTIT